MKKLFISIITVCILFFSILSVQASSYKFVANPSKTIVEYGDEVTIDLKVEDIDVGKDGINVVETTLIYDKNVFEKFEIIDKNNWNSTYNNQSGEKEGKLLFTKMATGVTDDEVIGVLKLKLKDNLDDINETQIKLLQVTSNDGYN